MKNRYNQSIDTKKIMSSPKKIRADKRKDLFKKGTDTLKQLAEALQVETELLARNVSDISGRIVDDNGVAHDVSYKLSRAELRALRKLIADTGKDYMTDAYYLARAKRIQSPVVSFSAYGKYDELLLRFFREATLGPLVSGNFAGKAEVRSKNVRLVANTKTESKTESPFTLIADTKGRAGWVEALKDYLPFTQQGADNYMYGVMTQGLVTALFALHAFYALPPSQGKVESGPGYNANIPISERGLRTSDNSGYNTASIEMRQILGPILQEVIDSDIVNLTNKYPDRASALSELRQHLLTALNNPTYIVPDLASDGKIYFPEYGPQKVFNPNKFPYSHFSKINSKTKVRMSEDEKIRFKENILQSLPAISAYMANDFANHSSLLQQSYSNSVKYLNSHPADTSAQNSEIANREAVQTFNTLVNGNASVSPIIPARPDLATIMLQSDIITLSKGYREVEAKNDPIRKAIATAKKSATSAKKKTERAAANATR